ncbi:sialate O-acetylesterase [Rubripirellula amarantea]|nr:sialate O-acetylesterase [Rubripirellula amarantea]
MPYNLLGARRSHTIFATLALTLMVPSSQMLLADETADSAEELQVSKDKFHIYLLIGQSNMAGRGKMSAKDRLPTPNVFTLDSNNQWKAASHPLHFDKPNIAGVGLGLDFAIAMLASDPDIKIGLVPSAVGGTSLKQWSKGGEFYEAALTRTKIAEKQGTLKGILWHQGESDSGAGSASTYAERLAQLIADLRGDLDEPALPFVLGELGDFRVGVKRRSDIVIEQQQSIPSLVPHTACVSAKGLGHKGDGTHFGAKSLREFGKRYAKAMTALQTPADEKAGTDQIP